MGWDHNGWDGKVDLPPPIRPTDRGWQPVLGTHSYARPYHMLTSKERNAVLDQWRGSSFYAQLQYHYWIYMDMIGDAK